MAYNNIANINTGNEIHSKYIKAKRTSYDDSMMISTVIYSFSFFMILFSTSRYNAIEPLALFNAVYSILFIIDILQRKISMDRICKWLLFYIAIIFFNVFFVARYSRSIQMSLCYTAVLLVFCLMASKSWGKQEIRFLIQSYLIACVCIVIKMLFELNNKGRPGGYTISFLGVLQDNNYLAAVMVFSAVVSTYRIINLNYKKNVIEVISDFIIFIFLNFGVLFTGSRAAMITVIITYIFLFMTISRISLAKKIFTLISISAIIAFVIYIFLPGEVIARLFINSYIDGSNMKRWNFWQVGFQMFLNHPIIGNGMDSFNKIAPLYTTLRVTAVHNTFLEILLELGLLGFSVFFIFIFSIGVRLLKKKATALLALMIATFGVGMIISAIYSCFLWQNITLIYICLKYLEENPESTMRELLC